MANSAASHDASRPGPGTRSPRRSVLGAGVPAARPEPSWRRGGHGAEGWKDVDHRRSTVQRAARRDRHNTMRVKGRELRYQAAIRGWDQRGLAEAAGVSQATVSRAMAGGQVHRTTLL